MTTPYRVNGSGRSKTAADGRGPIGGVSGYDCRGAGTCEPCGLGARQLHRSVAAWRAQEHRADGRSARPGACAGPPSVAAPRGGAGRVGRCGGAGRGARAGVAGDRAAWAGGLLDCRRQRLSQAGQTLGGGGAAVLRAVGQAGHLSGGVQPLGGKGPPQPADRLPAVPAEAWANDPSRRAKAGVPETIGFETKTAIALGQLRQARANGVPVGIVLGDAGYGDETAFRVGVAELDLRYLLVVRAGTSVWPPGTGPLPPPPWSGRGRRPSRLRRDAENQPVTLRALASSLPARAWRHVTWREGSQGALSSRFAAVRVRPAHRDTQRSEPWPEEWLLIEWPEGESEPTKYWFSNLSRRTPLKRL